MARMRIAIDAMGADRGTAVMVEGALRAAREHGVGIVLVGRQPEIEGVLARSDVSGLDVRVLHAEDVVGMDELAPADAVRRMPDSSISRATILVRQGEADALVTAGHTGAAHAAALLRLGRSPGVRRPALATPFPTCRSPCVLIDIGANADVRPVFLLQFAIMGAAYAERALGIANPRVGLLTIGEERGKGNGLVQEVLPLLESSELNFVGNIEGRDIPVGNVDVAVTDGFTGNILVKFAEGAGAVVRQMIREEATHDPLSFVGALMMLPALRRVPNRMSYRSYGGAILLGARGVVVIGHGRSDAQAVQAAVGVAIRCVEGDLVGAIQQRVARAAARNLAGETGT
jgi:glycerol-3-phosphate acyltransferase PlsX